MNRRAVLIGVCSLLATGGCLDRALLGDEAIANREFTAYEPGSDFYDAAPPVDKPPQVTFDQEATTVEVTGKLFVGSSTCHQAALKESTYDADADTFAVTLGSGQKPNSGNACTGDESIDAYRALITFDEQLPATVEATELDNPGETETRVQNSDVER